jgi:hypothetical protein
VKDDTAAGVAIRPAFAADGPPAPRINEEHGIETARNSRFLLLPPRAAVVGMPDHAAIADRPTARAIDEMDVRQRRIMTKVFDDRRRLRGLVRVMRRRLARELVVGGKPAACHAKGTQNGRDMRQPKSDGEFLSDRVSSVIRATTIHSRLPFLKCEAPPRRRPF